VVPFRQCLLLLLPAVFFAEPGGVYVLPYVCAAALAILVLTGREKRKLLKRA
jgi:hypothetical protein